jgi:hypothetical protein
LIGLRRLRRIRRMKEDENIKKIFIKTQNVQTKVYPKVSGQAAWSENCKWYSSLPLCAVISLFCESV